MTKTALLVIDAQELITNDRLYVFEKFTANVRTLIAEARAKYPDSKEVNYICSFIESSKRGIIR